MHHHSTCPKQSMMTKEDFRKNGIASINYNLRLPVYFGHVSTKQSVDKVIVRRSKRAHNQITIKNLHLHTLSALSLKSNHA